VDDDTQLVTVTVTFPELVSLIAGQDVLEPLHRGGGNYEAADRSRMLKQRLEQQLVEAFAA
jgi:hypothetical protein